MLNQVSNQYPEYGQKEMAMEPCQPDPEKMLQRARQSRERVENDIESFKDIDSYYFPDSEKLIMMMFGAMHIKLVEMKKEEQYWLSEIDKD